MHKKNILLFLVLLLVLTGCTDGTSLPAESKNTPSHQNNTHSNTEQEHPKETTESAIHGNPNTITPSDNSATENPEKTLNEILDELRELDELINGV